MASDPRKMSEMMAVGGGRKDDDGQQQQAQDTSASGGSLSPSGGGAGESFRFTPTKSIPVMGHQGVAAPTTTEKLMNRTKRRGPKKSKEQKLEENKIAARESRKRKKVFMEEMQRSLVFYSKSNATLKAENEELKRRLAQAEAKIQELSNLLHLNSTGQSQNYPLVGHSGLTTYVVEHHQGGSSSEYMSSDGSSNANDEEARRAKVAGLQMGVEHAIKEAAKGMQEAAAMQISQLGQLPMPPQGP